jgi:galactokinase/mevalonate kinase-like predicted kinase
MTSDLRTIRVLYEQLHVLRAQVEALKPEEADKPGAPGSGVTVLIPKFNSFLPRARAILSNEPTLLESVAEVQPVKQFDEHIRAAYHKMAKQDILFGTNILLQALAPLLVQGAGASSAVTVEREGLFVAGQHFDALQLAVQVFSRAKQDIVIIDAYIDHRLLQLLAMKHEAVRARILTSTRSLPPDIPTLAGAFNKQYGQKGALSVRTSNAFHDRFLIIDDSDYYHFGASLKDAGTRGFMFSRIEEPPVIDMLRRSFEEEWLRAQAVV